jgi:hypothetical protein
MVYVESKRAGQRVIQSTIRFIEQRLKLRVNAEKSALAPATTRPFLGFGFYRRGGKVRIGVSPVGWTAYYSLADGERPFSDLDEWLRRRLRQVRSKEWKRPATRRRNLRALGIPDRSAREWAGSGKGYWRIAGSYVLSRALPNAYWADHALKGFTDPYRRFREC